MNAAETARSSVAFRVVTACVSVAILTGCIPDDARSTTASGSESSGVVERVVDGDTIEVRLATVASRSGSAFSGSTLPRPSTPTPTCSAGGRKWAGVEVDPVVHHADEMALVIVRKALSTR